MSKPSFLGVVKAVNRVCLGVAAGAAAGAFAGAAVFVWQLILQEVGHPGWIEFEPQTDLSLPVLAGAWPGLFVGGFVGFVIGLWKLLRPGRLKLR